MKRSDYTVDLPDVTILAVTTRDHAATRHAIEKTLSLCDVRDVQVFTDRSDWLGADWKFHPVPVFSGEPSLSQFGLREIPKYADGFAEFTITVHWDGFVVNPEGFHKAFRHCDYIGAPWADGVVGNGGFFWMSKRMWKAIGSLDIHPDHCWPGDDVICRHRRAELEAMGMYYADWDLAHLFSVENEDYQGGFGFHGYHTLVDVIKKGLYL